MLLRLVLIVVFGAVGCVHVPAIKPSAGINSTKIAAHVKFLAQPALKGRKPESHGSSVAREYIVNHFKAYGLVPWTGEKSYVQSFGYGNNVIGVLPGADTNLASEFVLVSAHYDHLGKDHGKLCLGAADNASGVAALLETAKQLSLFEKRPKRSVVFTAFDAEEVMLVGSFVFTCRPDVEKARIVAVLNMDILGRDFMDVMSNTLFVTGTEQYPALREQIFRSGTNVGVNVRPIGTDVIGPRGDHVAFEERPIPCMFFSSGMYGDYHKPSDTPEKLNYGAIERSTRIVFETVQKLANGAEIRSVPMANGCDPEELRTMQCVMSELSTNSVRAGFKKESAQVFEKLTAEIDELSKSGDYNPKTRARLIVHASGMLAPYFMQMGGADGAQQEDNFLFAAIPFLQQHYAEHKGEWIQGCREVVRQILKYRPGLIRNMPKFHYEIAAITDKDISLIDRGNGRYALNVLFNCADVTVEKGWLGFSGSFGLSIDGFDGEGTREQLADLTLLSLRCERSNPQHFKELSKVLSVVTGVEAKGNYAALIERRLKQGGFKSETEWLIHCMLSDCTELARTATWCARGDSFKDPRIRDTACELVADRNVRPDVRAAAIELLAKTNDRKALLQLCNVLVETTPAYRKEYTAIFDKDYPFPGAKETLLPIYEKMWEQQHDSKKTIGQVAATQLKRATKKDFRTDQQAWQKWVETKVK